MTAKLIWEEEDCGEEYICTFSFQLRSKGVHFSFSPEGEDLSEYKNILEAIENDGTYTYDFGESNGGGSISIDIGTITFAMAKYGCGNGGSQDIVFNSGLFKDAITKLVDNLTKLKEKNRTSDVTPPVDVTPSNEGAKLEWIPSLNFPTWKLKLEIPGNPFCYQSNSMTIAKGLMVSLLVPTEQKFSYINGHILIHSGVIQFCTENGCGTEQVQSFSLSLFKDAILELGEKYENWEEGRRK